MLQYNVNCQNADTTKSKFAYTRVSQPVGHGKIFDGQWPGIEIE